MARSGFIAHASEKSHYLQFYNHYLNGFKGGSGEPYSSAEQILQILKEIDIPHKVEKLFTKMLFQRKHLCKLKDICNVVFLMIQLTLRKCSKIRLQDHI